MADQPLVIGSIVPLDLNNIPRKSFPKTFEIRGKQPELMPNPMDMHFNYMTDIWRVDFFGDNRSMGFTTRLDKLWVRIWTRFFFRSRWTRL